MNENTNTPVYLWLLSQSINNDCDTYDSAVVAASTEDEARLIHPRMQDEWWRNNLQDDELAWMREDARGGGEWARPDLVNVQCIGIADESVVAGTVVCASFNAG